MHKSGLCVGCTKSHKKEMAAVRHNAPCLSFALTVNVEFSYAVALSAREYCLSEARGRMIRPFRNLSFVWPALSDAIIEFRFLRLLASACVAVGCASGSAKLGVSFNAHLGVIDVCQI